MEFSLNGNIERDHQRELWMRSLGHGPTCFKQLRVTIRTFRNICAMLRDKGGLVVTNNVTLEEVITIFLQILSHGQKNSTITSTFMCSESYQ
ncbi:hypothetical protein PHJA_002296900 [Phtheirospermum japonicum]|uniref:DUF8040 domain-containing protein n=1 Tax=Phtheirospermum japonicum TaxID=374723 RepID=A0A830CRA4_9LAMI|nr:hypothetical protein PHJA_002296900 [Phtheirospermum japonicum]